MKPNPPLTFLCFFLALCFTWNTSFGTSIKWTPGTGTTHEDNPAAKAPRSQKYWEEHNIQRPDYAKTDQEVYMEQQQQKYQQKQKKKHEQYQYYQHHHQQEVFSIPIPKWCFGVIILFVVCIGYHTELSVSSTSQGGGRPNRQMRQFTSRKIWDQTRHHHLHRTASSSSPPSFMQRYIPILRAILYELQPLRLSVLLEYPWSIKLRQFRRFIYQLYGLLKMLIQFLTVQFGKMTKYMSSYWGWKDYVNFLVLPIGYCYVLVYLHRLFDAGPLIIIITLLTLIFSIGLSNNANHDNQTSAYSVFNRGFQQLLGSVDVESLVAQHVGGGGMMAFQAQQQMQQQPPHDPMEERDHAEDEMPPAQRRQNDNDDDDDENHGNYNNTTSRKSGKKARRRRNIEERRDRQLQRERARELGFENENGNGGFDAIDVDQMEQMDPQEGR